MRGKVLVCLGFAFVTSCSAPESKAPPSTARTSADWICGSIEQCAGDLNRYPADPKLRNQYARVLTKSGRLGAAAKEYRAALKLADDDPSVIEDAAKGLATLGDADGCLAELDTILAEGGAGRADKHAAAKRARAYCERSKH